MSVAGSQFGKPIWTVDVLIPVTPCATWVAEVSPENRSIFSDSCQILSWDFLFSQLALSQSLLSSLFSSLPLFPLSFLSFSLLASFTSSFLLPLSSQLFPSPLSFAFFSFRLSLSLLFALPLNEEGSATQRNDRKQSDATRISKAGRRPGSELCTGDGLEHLGTSIESACAYGQLQEDDHLLLWCSTTATVIRNFREYSV